MHQMTDEILSFEDGVWCCFFMVNSDESLVDGISLQCDVCKPMCPPHRFQTPLCLRNNSRIDLYTLS